MINVLQVGMTANIGGMETYLMNQYRHINKTLLHYDFVNITADSSIAFENEILNNGSEIYNICRRSRNPLKHYYQWWKLLANTRGKYDVIVFNTCHLYYVFPLFIAKFFGIRKRIVHSHNNGDEIRLSVWRKSLIAINKRILFFSATDYWACSASAGKWMFGVRPFVIIHNAIETSKFKFNKLIRDKKRRELSLHGKFVIGHVGRFSYQKNHKFLLEVFGEVSKAMNNAVLMLVGDAAKSDKLIWQEIHSMIDRMGLQDKVLFMGMRDDVNELMQAMDVFVFPSRFEGLGIVGIEAQTAGLPCYFSQFVSREINLTNLVKYLPLCLNEWIHNILECKVHNRWDMSDRIKEMGYSIEQEISQIEENFRAEVRNQ
ncbi:glycosyltransferase family 1 protein [Pectinatus haikarae]|uniref:glycosyltransferase family 1 protein n=1 Tax=Pectinatus haikarae TaxID=349096 RepID=UPI0018C6BCE7|nr:glycosyltransferase family 1 protein [Pectinatus haikarae]